MTPPPVRLMLADVDGTLVTQEKVLTDRAIAAVHRLHKAGILFAITSGRPPRGMAMLIEPLDLQTPIAAFNGGLLVNRDMTVIEQRVLPEDLVVPIADLMTSFDLSVWVYRGADWYVPDLKGPHVDREAWTVKFQPKVMASVKDVADNVAKIVGVSDDHDAVSKAAAAAHDRFGDHVTAAASQPYYLDVTHPQANKGEVAKYLAQKYQISTDEIATIGDMPNDVLMFAHSGLSIAMGNADVQVQRAARRVTDTNENEGFAKAVERFVLPSPTKMVETISGGNKPWDTTPGVASSMTARVAGSPTSPKKSAMTPPFGLSGTSRRRTVPSRASVDSRPKAISSNGTGVCSASTIFVESAITTKRSAAMATNFSRVCAPPPPFTNQPSGLIWSAPSMARSSRSTANGPTCNPKLLATSWVRGEVATQWRDNLREARAGSK